MSSRSDVLTNIWILFSMENFQSHLISYDKESFEEYYMCSNMWTPEKITQIKKKVTTDIQEFKFHLSNILFSLFFHELLEQKTFPVHQNERKVL